MYVGMQETMVNAVHIYGNNKYIGTDDGLIIYDSNNERINNELTDMLNGISVRHITNDSNGNIWISTYRKYGLVKVSYNGRTACEMGNVARGGVFRGCGSVRVSHRQDARR